MSTRRKRPVSVGTMVPKVLSEMGIDGAVNRLVLHEGGSDLPMDRIQD